MCNLGGGDSFLREGRGDRVRGKDSEQAEKEKFAPLASVVVSCDTLVSASVPR